MNSCSPAAAGGSGCAGAVGQGEENIETGGGRMRRLLLTGCLCALAVPSPPLQHDTACTGFVGCAACSGTAR